MESYWSYGVVPWLPILIVLVVVLIAAGLIPVIFDGGQGDGLIFGIGIWVLALGLIAGILVGYYPYKSEYHRWYHIQGSVTETSSRLVPSDKSVAQRFVLVIDGQPYGVDDTRASVVKAGDTVDLSCKREFQFNSESGWACRWGWNPR